MGSWIILIDHGIASQPIIEHYSQFVVRLARVKPQKLTDRGRESLSNTQTAIGLTREIAGSLGNSLHWCMLPVLTI